MRASSHLIAARRRTRRLLPLIRSKLSTMHPGLARMTHTGQVKLRETQVRGHSGQEVGRWQQNSRTLTAEVATAEIAGARPSFPPELLVGVIGSAVVAAWLPGVARWACWRFAMRLCVTPLCGYAVMRHAVTLSRCHAVTPRCGYAVMRSCRHAAMRSRRHTDGLMVDRCRWRSHLVTSPAVRCCPADCLH